MATNKIFRNNYRAMLAQKAARDGRSVESFKINHLRQATGMASALAASMHRADPKFDPSRISLTTAHRIADYLGCTVDELFPIEERKIE